MMTIEEAIEKITADAVETAEAAQRAYEEAKEAKAKADDALHTIQMMRSFGAFK